MPYRNLRFSRCWRWPAAAQLPDLRIEPTAGGSIFYVKNTSVNR